MGPETMDESGRGKPSGGKETSAAIEAYAQMLQIELRGQQNVGRDVATDVPHTPSPLASFEG
jgi:hypothetical protein